MELLHAEYLVVLAPAMLSAAVGLIVNGAGLRISLQSILGCREHVDTLIGLMVSSAFIGPASGVVLGYGGDSREAFVTGAVVGIAALFAVMRLSSLAAELADAESKTTHRKMAGTVRSIIRSELLAAKRAQANEAARKVSRRRIRHKLVCTCVTCLGTPLKSRRSGHRMKGSFK